MWGANKWTDQMFKKYWWVVLIMIAAFILYQYYADKN